MRALAHAGWQTLTLAAYSRAVTAPSSAPRHQFLLTFDDGYASLADSAYPVLSALGFTATTFLITDYVGALNTWDLRYTWRRVPHLDWPAIERWRAQGLDFASHGASHARLTWLGDAQVSDELGRSRETLRQRLGADAARAIAYPFAAWDRRIERLAAAAGYELGFGGVRGDGSPLGLARVPVYLWDRANVPFGLRDDVVGSLGRFVANIANRCAVGTSWIRKLQGGRGGAEALP